jgi:putative SOS response-associated peptidase YedK
MCGRYLTPDQSALERYWGLTAPPDFAQSFNVAPSRPAPLIRVDREGRQFLGMLTWGFRPGWAKRAWINARSESVFETKAFAAAARKRRALVPALGWYEWQGQAAPRVPYLFHGAGFQPIAFAGIWTGRETAEGWEHSFAILTTAAAEAFAPIHDRMPAVLRPEDHAIWLDPAAGEADLQAALARPLDAIECYRVSDYVNKPAHDDARCIAPLAESAPAS